ncbi:2-amino-4-hydroxy-6-hydroxymethyldihydropteridine diphosphokinase [Alteromonas oceanisediminis]|uniref:2-amino-4-hydroxy-6- hydroxymethyldihydropteridine diphosphokinase n=1 Tax=Alteromonas oceanisediminis TaxID=2836180 RepID=UPI001BD99211|nr:2-amino-4-hydroxy-6-hydroxymethyldihydropteridine diphosphokinase [Alteromonas oceanisediminis]MBT0587682.1 2-amino-4-hydroxy-6-hydroxymethyldihydropteridine diphosphokinase [Alteromonas oceanisediminis]
MHEQVFIGLGSNLQHPNFGSPQAQIERAIKILAAQEQLTVISVSSIYASAPMGPPDQPDYANAVAQLNCAASADELLDLLQRIELDFGRERKQERWGPRTLDLDILLFDQQMIHSQRLTVPHYGMAEREFVLVPLYELAPDMVMPDGRPIAAWVAQCSLKGLKRVKSLHKDTSNAEELSS